MGTGNAEDNHRSKLVRSENFISHLPLLHHSLLAKRWTALSTSSTPAVSFFYIEAFRCSFSTADLRPDRSRDALSFIVISDGCLPFFRHFSTDIRHG